MKEPNYINLVRDGQVVGNLRIIAGLSPWVYDIATGELAHLEVEDRESRRSSDGKVVASIKMAVGEHGKGYCMAVNRKNALRKFHKRYGTPKENPGEAAR